MTHHDAVRDAVQQAIEELEAASSAFTSGDPAPFTALWSHAEDITIMGAWGAYEKGWEQVGPRMDWAARVAFARGTSRTNRSRWG